MWKNLALSWGSFRQLLVVIIFLQFHQIKGFQNYLAILSQNARDFPLNSYSQSCLKDNGMQIRKTQVDVQEKDIARSNF